MKANILFLLQVSALSRVVRSSPAKFRNFLDCDCGEVRPSGGEEPSLVEGEAGRNEFPWAARLEIRIGEKSFQCGGTLLTDRHVLTAAHCVKPGNESLYVTVILGEHSVSRWDRTELAVFVSRYHIHPLYQETNWLYDFAILTLIQPVKFPENPLIRPICLPAAGDLDHPHHTPLLTHGWGKGLTGVRYTDYLHTCNSSYDNHNCFIYGNDSTSATADVLQKMELLSITQSECSQTYGEINNFLKNKPIVIFDHNICTVKPTGSGHVCSGDSGNGVIHKTSSEKYTIIGVVSYGLGCGSEFGGKPLPEISGRVSKVVDWVYENTQDGAFCNV